MKIEIKATIEFDPELWAYFDLCGGKQWFIDQLNGENGTEKASVMLFSNEAGDEIGTTRDFEYSILTK